jgi:predicted dehydrogenase
MSLKVSLWGTNGRINADRQEVQVYIRDLPDPVENLTQGWNVRYTTELTRPVWFYVRGEEYSAQIDHFVQCIKTGATPISSFRSASDAVLVAAMMRRDSNKQGTPVSSDSDSGSVELLAQPGRPRSVIRTVFRRLLGAGQT